MLKKLLSISIASAVMASSLTVSANTQQDDQKDSVKGWGKWAQQYSTAAGGEINTNALSFASLGQSESGRNGQNEAGFTEVEIDNSGNRNFTSWGYNPSCCQVTSGTERGEISWTVDGAEGTFTVETDTQRYSSEVLGNVSRSVAGVSYDTDYFYSDPGTIDWTFLSFEKGDGDYYRGFWYEDTSGNGVSGWPSNHGFFIVGETSSLAAVNQMANNVIAGNVSAFYTGDFLGNQGGAAITVRFGGENSWSGNFSPTGFAAFSASGSIEGVNLKGSITTSGVSGSVDASFFGDSAQVIAGITEASANGNDFVGVFEAAQAPVDIR